MKPDIKWAELLGRSFLFFKEQVINTDFETIVDKHSVHYCEKFEYEELYLERHRKTIYQAIFTLAGGKEIVLTEYDLQELSKEMNNLIVPVSELWDAYQADGNFKIINTF